MYFTPGIGEGAGIARNFPISPGPAWTIRRAVINARRDWHISRWAADLLLGHLATGRVLPLDIHRALCWCLVLDIDAGRLRAMPAEEAARALGGWI
ncbi:hypothetical protein [Methylomagnum sp.]